MGTRRVEKRRLAIHRETLRSLTDAALGEVHGGARPMPDSDDGQTLPKSNAWTGAVESALLICQFA